jgi:PAS domain S-box-containing protein
MRREAAREAARGSGQDPLDDLPVAPATLGRRVASDVVILTLLLGVGAYGAWRLTTGASDDEVASVANAVTIIFGAAAWALAVAASRSGQPDTAMRSVWGWLALAVFATLLGDIIWTILEAITGEPPAVSVGDVAYLAFYPLVFRGLMRIPGTGRLSDTRGLFLIDGLTIGVVGVMVEWALTIGPMLESGAQDLWPTVVAVAYPVGDVVLVLALGLVIMRRGIRPGDLPFLLLVTAFSLNLIGDAAWQSTWLADTSASGGFGDFCFMAASALIGSSAFLHARRVSSPRPTDQARPTDSLSILPHLAAVLGLAVFLITSRHEWGLTEGFIGIGGVALVLLLLVRQTVVARLAVRYATEAADVRAEARFETLIRQSTALIMVIDPDGVIRYEAPSASQSTVVASSKREGLGIAQLAHEDDRERLSAFVTAAAGAGASPAPVIWRIQGADGAWRWVETTAVNRLREPAIGGLVMTSRDVTDEVRLQSDLEQARRMEAIGRLAGGVAHDFNNLLMGIGGFAELLVGSMDQNDPRRADAMEILRATHRASDLTAQLLSFARRRVVREDVLDLGALVRETVPLVERLVGASVAVRTDLPSGLPGVVGDGSQIQQVLLNLAANARDAMPDGGSIGLSVRAELLEGSAALERETTAAGWHVILTVSDTGAGMDPATKARLFEPFFTTKELGRGTGLGLASAYGIIHQAHGWITVESAVGAGTTIEVYLPATTAAPQSAASVADEVVVAVPARPEAHAERILLVDDEALVLSAVSRMLERAGYRVIAFARPGEALAFASATPDAFDALVTDVVMPDMNGPSLAQAIGAIHPGLPVLFISGDPRTEVPGNLLSKPFSGDQFAASLRETIDQARVS